MFADQWSRLHDPHKRKAIPEMFRLAPRAIPQIRSRSWYRALAVPCNGRLAAHRERFLEPDAATKNKSPQQNNHGVVGLPLRHPLTRRSSYRWGSLLTLACGVGGGGCWWWWSGQHVHALTWMWDRVTAARGSEHVHRLVKSPLATCNQCVTIQCGRAHVPP